jgi:3-deoxy-D-manno-octulosonic-acid transferase
MFNFAAAAEAALAAGAARRVGDVDEALRCMAEITADPLARSRMVAAALAFAAAHRGATERTAALIEQALDGAMQKLPRAAHLSPLPRAGEG